MKRRVCEDCGTSNAAKTKFCGTCGKPLPECVPATEPPTRTLDAAALNALETLAPPAETAPIADLSLVPGAGTVPCEAARAVPASPVTAMEVRSDLMKVTCIQGTNRGESRALVDADSISIGASADAQFCLADDPYVSRLHATLSRRGEEIVVRDLSTNGTYLRIEGQARVPVGSVLLIGNQVVQVGWYE